MLVLLICVGLLALFWSALTDLLKLWAVSLCAAAVVLVSLNGLPHQREELLQRQQDQQLIEAEIEAVKNESRNH